MIQIPLGNGGVVVVIEPGNIERLKAGRPVIVGDSLVAYTPDMAALLKFLGAEEEMPQKGQGPKSISIKPVTPEDFAKALNACLNLPEVLR